MLRFASVYEIDYRSSWWTWTIDCVLVRHGHLLLAPIFAVHI